MLDNRVKTLPNQPTLAQERLSTAVLRELHRRPSHCMVAALPPLYHHKYGRNRGSSMDTWSPPYDGKH